MATMKQIAEIAGVSRGTVDRVLNHRGAVRAETEQRVTEVANLLNYTPNEVARSLSFSKQHLKLGCILFDPEKVSFYRQVAKGLEQKTRELQQFSVTVETRYCDFSDPSSQDRLLDELADSGVHGIVLYGLNQESTREKIAELAEKGIPVVTANSDIPDSRRIAYVGCDYVQAGRIGGRLIDLCLKGEGSVGVVLGARQVLCLEGRLQGFTEYLEKNAPGIQIVEIKRDNPDDFTMFSAVKELLDKYPQMNALLVDAGNSYGACRAIELSPGERRPIMVGYDCFGQTEEMLKKKIITATITQQPQRQGAMPLQILMDYLGTDPLPIREFNYTNLGIMVSESL